ncbi:MAG: hypothetical protein ACYDA6_01220, partial [Solirubrobacteraceae bacterium]
MAERFSIAQVTPHAWESGHEVNRYVHAVAAGLTARGHSVLIVAPSRSEQRVRQSRDALQAARKRQDASLGDLLGALEAHGPAIEDGSPG